MRRFFGSSQRALAQQSGDRTAGATVHTAAVKEVSTAQKRMEQLTAEEKLRRVPSRRRTDQQLNLGQEIVTED
jgi:hypothetical protein